MKISKIFIKVNIKFEINIIILINKLLSSLNVKKQNATYDNFLKVCFKFV